MQLSKVIPPASWTIVMASGVVAVDLYNVHLLVLSTITLGFAAAVWLFLAVLLGAPLAYRRGRFRGLAESPVSLAAVAATAVLGTGLAMYDYRVAAAVLLATAAIGWALLVVPVLRHWKTPTVGISFVLGVATDGVALLSATLAIIYRAGWLISAGVLFLLLGLAFYVFTASRFDLRQLINGHGDHWIAGGALAISALAAAKLTEAADTLGRYSDQHQLLATATLVLWCLAMAWLPPLIISEAIRPRLGYDIRRWATVFPSARTPRAASPSATSPASPGSPPSARWGHGSRSPPSCSRSPGCSAPSITPGGQRAPPARSLNRIPVSRTTLSRADRKDN